MANLALSPQSPFSIATTDTSTTGVLQVARHLRDLVIRHHRNRQGERQLWGMSDTQLHDLGITRGDIRRVAWQPDT